MTVVYIGGAGRSGSTLLERILGNLPACFSAGELRFFWQYVSEGGRLCGCGQPIGECPFWRPVIEEVSRAADITALASTAARIDRSRHALWADRIHGGAFRSLAAATAALYSIVRRHSAARYLIDSSKTPTHLRLLIASGLDDVRAIRLVRDSRAVAHAWSQRPKLDPGSGIVDGRMPRRDSRRAALTWSWEVLLLARLSKQLARRTEVRYEDLAADVVFELTRVTRELELEQVNPGDLERLSGDIDLRPTHSIGGNPLRFERRLRVHPSSRQWELELKGVNRLLVTVLTLPGLMRYRYPLRVRR